MIKNLNVEKAVKICGGLSAISKKLGIAPPTVHQWIVGIRPVPIERCVAIEQVTGGAVTRQDLRPDDWRKIWPELADDGLSRPCAGEVGAGVGGGAQETGGEMDEEEKRRARETRQGLNDG